MDDGGLLFWLIVFGVAVLQAVGQKKKKPGGAKGKARPTPRPSGTVRADAEAAPIDPRTAPAEAGTRGRGASSEGMIPSDVWEEILGLARGTPPPPPPEPPAPPDAEVRPLPPPAVTAEGWDPQEPRRPPVPKARVPLAVSAQMETEGAAARDVKGEIFGTGSLQELRKAIILREVLGPPVTLRED